MEQYVIQVNEYDEVVGVIEKMEAHKSGTLHRAFSVFIFNSKGEMLLQQRAMNKYHSAGLWSNACCSHPKPGEETLPAAKKRLKEEMGFETALTRLYTLLYKAAFDNGLTEHEFDHVFVGEYDGDITFNKEEVMNYNYTGMKRIREELGIEPEKYSAWFKLIFPRVEEWWKEKYSTSSVKQV
ncbi:MAG TPA: isopentenyl-diphosphate Delta-isomerase [Chitinophagaceae bacterium]